MWLFLVVVLSVYTAVHAYVFWRVRAAWPTMGWWALLLGLFFVSMIGGLFAVRLLEQTGHVRLARVLAGAAHSWIAIVFWLFCLFVGVQAWNLLVRLAGLAWNPAAAGAILPRPALWGVLALVAVMTGWSLVEARLIRGREIVLYTEALPAGHPGLLIAQISDLHLGADTGSGRLRRAISIIQAARPDVVVATGDVVDAHYEDLAHQAQMLAELKPPLGKYAVLGNHEFYAGVATSTRFLEAAGFRLLRQEAAEAGEHLEIVGVDDPAREGRRNDRRSDEGSVLPPPGQERFTLLLKHRPNIRIESLGRFDLQLSGHTHGGQIFPANYLVGIVLDFGPGLHELGDGSRLYLSTGAGTWGPAMRLGAWPEVALIRLLPLGSPPAGKPGAPAPRTPPATGPS
jgi:hypothetical protein